MARRLNKKVALIGGAVGLLMGLILIVVVLWLTQDPSKFLEDGNVAFKAGDLEKAERNYLRARSRAKDNEFRLGALKKLVDVYLETEQWPQLRGVWGEILQIDDNDFATRYARLKYFYIVCSSGASRQLWNDVEEQATEFLDKLTDEQLKEDTAQWENPLYEKVQLVHEPLAGSDGVQRIGQYLYLVRGQAKINIAVSGAATEPDVLLDEALADLEKAKELEPTNIAISENIAQVYLAKGNLAATKGLDNERQKAQQQAIDILKDTVKNNPDNADAAVSLLATEQSTQLSQAQGVDSKELLSTFEPQYNALAEKFPDSDIVHVSLAQYYYRLGADHLDQAIAEVEKAIQLAGEKVSYSLTLASFYDLKFAMSDDTAVRQKAIDVINGILDSPALKETQGPNQFRNINNRLRAYSSLAWLYLDAIVNEPQTVSKEQKQQWLDLSEKAVYEIEQIFGSGENPQVVKWRAILELAKGDKADAVGKLYAIYQQQKAAKKTDTELAYFLAKQFDGSNEFGAVIDFYSSALKLNPDDRGNPNTSMVTRRPQILLDYAQLLIRGKIPSTAANFINSYEINYGRNDRSRDLLIAALVDSGNYDKAQEIFDAAGSGDQKLLQLKARLLMRKLSAAKGKIVSEQLKSNETAINAQSQTNEPAQQEPVDVDALKKDVAAYSKELVPMLKTLIEVEPNALSEAVIISACRDLQNYVTDNDARDLAQYYLKYNPKNILVNIYLKSMDLQGQATPEQISEIRNEVISQIDDPMERAFRLGVIYREDGEDEKAKEQFLKVFNDYKTNIDNENLERARQILGRMSVSYLFETVIKLKDWDTAQSVIDVVQKKNMDQCNGDFFRARLAIVREQNNEALTYLGNCLKQKPIFSRAYLMRGQVNQKLGNNDEAINDYKQAMNLNPLDATNVKALAVALYNRNLSLGDNVTNDQYIEAKRVIGRAVSLQPNDTQLLNFYAYYIKDEEPQKALAIVQRIYKYSPTVENGLRLANMATSLADKEINNDKKQLYLDLAGETYEKALQLDPSNTAVASAYASYYQSIGQPEKADELIANAQNKNLAWQYYVNLGRYQQAKQVLDELYKQQPKDPNVIKGLLIVAERTINGEDFSKMADVLVKLNDTKENRLIQIAGLINTGLINDADKKLQSYMEQYKDDPQGQLLASEISMKQGKLDNALDLINRYLASDEDNAYAWYLRGQINTVIGDYSQAITDINKSRSIADNAQSKIALARAYILSKRYADAITELSSIAYEPTTPENARYLLEAVYYQTKDDAGLQAFYQKIINTFPDNVIWLSKIANYSLSRKDYNTAQQLYNLAWQKSNQQNQPNAGALSGLFISLIQGNKLQQASDLAQQYIDSPYGHIALIAMGKIKKNQGDVQAAIDYFGKAADSVESNPGIAVNVLREMVNTVGPDKVRQYCQQKINADPGSVIGNYVLSKLALTDGNFNQAITYLDKCLETAKDDSPQAYQFNSEKADVLARAFQRSSDNNYLDKAIVIWKELLKKNPNDIGVLNNIAYMLADTEKDVKKSLDYAQKAQQLNPNNPAILDTYAYVLYKNGRFEEAGQYAQSSIQLFQDRQPYAPVDVYEHLGMIKEKLKDTDGAIDAYKKAIEAGGENLPQAQSKRLNDALLRIANQ